MPTQDYESLPLLDLTSRITEPAVVATWSLASPDPSNLAHRQRVLALYPPAGLRAMYGLEHDGVILATCGVTRVDAGGITVHQMATHADYRRRGLGRRLLAAIIDKLHPTSIRCGTDAPNDKFYGACGFVCDSEGFPPSGIERFRCTWTAPASAGGA
jgi:GNAT superfamily N-acetyltransferase